MNVRINRGILQKMYGVKIESAGKKGKGSKVKTNYKLIHTHPFDPIDYTVRAVEIAEAEGDDEQKIRDR